QYNRLIVDLMVDLAADIMVDIIDLCDIIVVITINKTNKFEK
ncbi:24529_t:CDS:1, partial [Racocetra persica]